MKQPDQDLHDELMARLLAKGYRVFTTLPDLDTPYPFVVMGVTRTVPKATKTRLIGLVRLDVHVWGSVDDRLTLSDMLGEIRAEAYRLRTTSSRQWLLSGSPSDIAKDTSAEQVLYHGILELSYKFI